MSIKKNQYVTYVPTKAQFPAVFRVLEVEGECAKLQYIGEDVNGMLGRPSSNAGGEMFAKLDSLVEYKETAVNPILNK